MTVGDLPPVTLVLGGARSGKSRHAESLIEAGPGEPVYLATAEPADDPEMVARIRAHRARRGPRWRTVEEPLDLAAALLRECAPNRAVLVDCLTLWISNLMAAGRAIEAESQALVDVLPSLRGPVVLVSNEVGQGIVPVNAVARSFRDHAGLVHQALAARAQSVVFMVAGLPMNLKAPSVGALA